MLFQIPAFLAEGLERYIQGSQKVDPTAQGYTKPVTLAARAAKFCTVALAWNLLCVTQLMPRI